MWPSKGFSQGKFQEMLSSSPLLWYDSWSSPKYKRHSRAICCSCDWHVASLCHSNFGVLRAKVNIEYESLGLRVQEGWWELHIINSFHCWRFWRQIITSSTVVTRGSNQMLTKGVVHNQWWLFVKRWNYYNYYYTQHWYNYRTTRLPVKSYFPSPLLRAKISYTVVYKALDWMNRLECIR